MCVLWFVRRLSAHESVATVLLADSSNAAPETLEIQHLASSLPSCHSTLNDASKMFEIVSKLSLNCFCETFCNCSTFTVNSGRVFQSNWWKQSELWGFFSSTTESFQLSSSFDRVPRASAWIEMLMGIHVSLYHWRMRKFRGSYTVTTPLSQSDFNVCWSIRWLHDLAALLEFTFDVDVRRWKNGVVLYLCHECISVVLWNQWTPQETQWQTSCCVWWKTVKQLPDSPVERITYNHTGWPG